MSQAWLVIAHDESHNPPRLELRGESDAAIMQGLMAVLLALYADRPAKEAAEIDLVTCFEALHLIQSLSMQRSSALMGLASRIRAEARAMAERGANTTDPLPGPSAQFSNLPPRH